MIIHGADQIVVAIDRDRILLASRDVYSLELLVYYIQQAGAQYGSYKIIIPDELVPVIERAGLDLRKSNVSDMICTFCGDQHKVYIACEAHLLHYMQTPGPNLKVIVAGDYSMASVTDLCKRTFENWEGDNGNTRR